MTAAWAGWAKGRILWLPAAGWLAALGVVYTQWWQGLDGSWAPHDDSYFVTVMEIAPVLAGLIGIWGILPRMDWVDAQATTHPQRRDTIAATILAAAFALIPPLTRWLFTLNAAYTAFIPPDYTIADPAQLADALPTAVVWQLVPHIAGVLGLAILLTSILGRTFGPIAGLAGYIGILFIQGYRLAPALLPRMFDRTAPDAWVTPATGTILPSAILIAALAAFRLTHSGTTHPTRPTPGSARPRRHGIWQREQALRCPP